MLLHVYHYKLMGKPLLKFLNQNSWVWLLAINWVGKIIYLLCVKSLLVVLIKAGKVLRSESLKCLYYSFIYPYMIYYNQVWGSAYKTNMEPLFILQKRAVRIILGVHPRSPSEPLFTTLKFLNCGNIFKYLIGRLMYRIYHGKLRVLHCLFTKNSDIHVHNTRQKCHYHMPLCRTKLGKCGLRYVGASVWNNILSVNINPNVSEFIFSRSLKAAICNNLL